MPKHDIPDGHEANTNLIDIRAYLRRRVDLTAQDRDDQAPDVPDRETYRHAEYGDGKRPRFSRYDLIWAALILAIGWIVWVVVIARG